MFLRVGTQTGLARVAPGGGAALFSGLNPSPLLQVLPDAGMLANTLQPHEEHGLCGPRAGLPSLALEGSRIKDSEATPQEGNRGGVSSHLGWRMPSWELARVGQVKGVVSRILLLWL